MNRRPWWSRFLKKKMNQGIPCSRSLMNSSGDGISSSKPVRESRNIFFLNKIQFERERERERKSTLTSDVTEFIERWTGEEIVLVAAEQPIRSAQNRFVVVADVIRNRSWPVGIQITSSHILRTEEREEFDIFFFITNYFSNYHNKSMPTTLKMMS